MNAARVAAGKGNGKTINSEMLNLVEAIVKIKEHRKELVYVR